MKKFRIILYSLLLIGISCAVQAQEISNWRSELSKQLPYLGHRNWIVITDMAYPLQAKEGIMVWYANEPYQEVLSYVKQSIDRSPHVYAHVYQDKELSLLNEKLCPGIAAFKQECASVFGHTKVQSMDHEQLIARLDDISEKFQVLIIKTNLTLPYTTTFFELDCKYWNAEKQKQLENGM